MESVRLQLLATVETITVTATSLSSILSRESDALRTNRLDDLENIIDAKEVHFEELANLNAVHATLQKSYCAELSIAVTTDLNIAQGTQDGQLQGAAIMCEVALRTLHENMREVASLLNASIRLVGQLRQFTETAFPQLVGTRRKLATNA